MKSLILPTLGICILDKISEESKQGRSLLKDKAYDVLKRRILDEEFPPGTFLSERKLAEMLGMSKTPVKAALERLEFEGFVAVSPQQCILVRDLSFETIADQYEIRSALETFVVSKLAERITDDQISQIRNCLKLQKENCESPTVREWIELDSAFHLLLAELIGNQSIHRVMLDLRDRMHRVISRVLRLHPLRAKESFLEHTEIAEAIFAGKSELAASLVAKHLQLGRDLVLAPKE